MGQSPPLQFHIKLMEMLEKNGENAIPSLIPLLYDDSWRVRWMAFETLSKLGAHATPVLIELLKESSPIISVQAVNFLGSLGANSTSAVQILIQILNQNLDTLIPAQEIKSQLSDLLNLQKQLSDRALHWTAIRGKRPNALHTIENIYQQLIDLDSQQVSLLLILSCLETLKKVGALATEAAPVFMKVLQSAIPSSLKIQFVQTLGYISPSIEKTIPYLLICLKEEDMDFQCHVLQTLGQLGGMARDAAPELISLIKKGMPQIRMEAVQALSLIGISASSLPELLVLLQDSDPDIRWFTLNTLASIGSISVPVLIELLQTPEHPDRSKVLAALINMGAEARDAIPALIDTLKDKDWQIRLDSIKALKQMGEIAHDAVPALIKMLDDPCSWVRIAAIKALGEIGVTAHMVISTLSTKLMYPDDSSQVIEIIKTLGKMGESAKPAIYAILQAQECEENEIQEVTVEALVRIGPTVIQELLVYLQNQYVDKVYQLVFHTLIKIGKPAMPILTPYLKDPKFRNIGADILEIMLHIETDKDQAMAILSEALDTQNMALQLTVLNALQDIDINPWAISVN